MARSFINARKAFGFPAPYPPEPRGVSVEFSATPPGVLLTCTVPAFFGDLVFSLAGNLGDSLVSAAEDINPRISGFTPLDVTSVFASCFNVWECCAIRLLAVTVAGVVSFPGVTVAFEGRLENAMDGLELTFVLSVVDNLGLVFEEEITGLDV